MEPTVDLKPGARILLLKNIDTRNEAKKEQPLVNGTTGRILRWATADEAEAALKAREVYLEDKLEAAREQRLAKGKRSHETSLERKLYEELQKLREHCAQHCGHDVDACVEIKILRRVRAESSRRPPRHRRDACSMAWRCRFLAARPSQDGRVIAEK